MNRALKLVLPIVVIAIGVLGATALKMSKDKPETRSASELLPMVRVLPIVLEDLEMTVRSQGTVRPRTESALVPEVSGRVIQVAGSFVSGGFFEEGDVLLTVDPHDYRQAIVDARSRVAQAQLRVSQEEAESQIARDEWQEIGVGDPTSLTLREPQLADARAALEAARAGLDRAERDLDRTEVRAPYAGRIREKTVDVGQFVARGTPLATMYAVDVAEIRLPLPDADLAFLDLPLDYRDGSANSGPRVVLRATFAGKEHKWNARIVRTEGEIDRRSRMVHVIAAVSDPYSRGDTPDRPPLAAGLFVEAEIFGKTVRDVAVIPRTAVRDDQRVLVVDDDDRVRFRMVEILRSSASRVVVHGGLADGDRLCVSPLSSATDGSRVRVATDEAS